MAQQYYVKHASNQPAVTKDCPCEFCATPAVDALGKPVPEWAREAFDILAKDGRRVQVVHEESGVWQDPIGTQAGDALLVRYYGNPSIHMREANGKAPPIRARDHGGSLADAARRALAMEAERKAAERAARIEEADAAYGARCAAAYEARTQPKIEALPPPCEEAAGVWRRMAEGWAAKALATKHMEAVAERARELLGPSAIDFNDPKYHPPSTRLPLPRCTMVPLPEPARRHNATCPRCHGPAFHGWGYAPTCEREGGCLADAVPVVALFDGPITTNPDVLECELDRGTGHAERVWMHRALPSSDKRSGPFATRDLAVTAWREAVLERAKREVGK